MAKVCLIRAPALPAYHDVDIKADPMISAIIGYLTSINFPIEDYDVYDFQLDKSITYNSLLSHDYDYYIIAARDVGESYRYSVRIANLLSRDTRAEVILYGQVAPLRLMTDLNTKIHIVNQSEQELAKLIGLPTTGSHFAKDLRYPSYYNRITLESWQKTRLKGVIETTRGCPYKCKFCFINVGKNYEKRWQTRPNEMIIQDLKSYIEQGVTQFVFLDSEFLGANPHYHEQKVELLERIINELPPIKYMALCRADTLLAFNNFALLKKSGLNKVLVGVESLHQPDLDYMRKDSTVENMMEAIQGLIEHDIEGCLTYLTFNRNTTIEGLRANFENIKTLYSHPKARYLGMPNFSFNMEILRGEETEAMEDVSDTTYIRPLLEARGQVNAAQVCFPSQMESLVEMYRMLQYEWVVKKCELIREKVGATNDVKEMIDSWFGGLGLFCVQIMEHYLSVFEQGNLTLSSIKDCYRDELFNFYRDYNESLPAHMRSISTQEHAKTLDYLSKADMADHGWDDIIPLIKEVV